MKDESFCPTGTFKDRLACALLEQLTTGDSGLLITCITMGNTAVSVAAALHDAFVAERKPQFLGIFPLGFAARQIGPDVQGRVMPGVRVLNLLERLDAKWIEHDLTVGYLAEREIRELAYSTGIRFTSHRDITNGIGTLCYGQIIEEALSACDYSFDFIVLPVGAGVLFDECVEVVERRRLATHVIGVSTLDKDSVADKIYGLYSPYFEEMFRTGWASHPRYPQHRVVTLDDQSILAAAGELPRTIRAEPSAAAAFVPLMDERFVPASARVLVINTGDGILNGGHS